MVEGARVQLAACSLQQPSMAWPKGNCIALQGRTFPNAVALSWKSCAATSVMMNICGWIRGKRGGHMEVGESRQRRAPCAFQRVGIAFLLPHVLTGKESPTPLSGLSRSRPVVIKRPECIPDKGVSQMDRPHRARSRRNERATASATRPVLACDELRRCPPSALARWGSTKAAPRI